MLRVRVEVLRPSGVVNPARHSMGIAEYSPEVSDDSIDSLSCTAVLRQSLFVRLWIHGRTIQPLYVELKHSQAHSDRLVRGAKVLDTEQ